MTRIQKYLSNNPRETKDLELSLLEIGINYFHLISLLWNPQKKTMTKEFLIWKTREILETLVNVAMENGLNVTDLNGRLLDAIEAFSQITNEEEIFRIIGVEIDNHPNNTYALSLDMKIAALIRLLEFKQITIEQIFEKY